MKKLTALLCGALLVAGTALAQQAFEDLDTDADGALSRAEVEVIEGMDFDAADTDQNGSLSLEEYETAMPAE